MGGKLLPVDTPESPESPRSKRRHLNRRRAQSYRARLASSSSDTTTIALREQAAAGKLFRADNYFLYLHIYPIYFIASPKGAATSDCAQG